MKLMVLSAAFLHLKTYTLALAVCQVMAQVLGSLTPPSQNWIEFLVLGYGFCTALAFVGHLVNESVDGKFFETLCSSISFN